MGAGWLSLIPARLMELPASGWELGRVQRLRGVVMIVDVCGFTAMSEAVGRGGPGATERLSRTINAVFTPIVELVHEHDGEVALFVGDAVVALLPDACSARACATAVHRTGSLELSVGLAAGELALTVVGDPAVRLEPVLLGSALARAARAERRAGPGRTVADDLSVSGSAAREPAEPPDPRALVAPFVHPSIAARLDAGRERLIAEHRRVTSLFCRFGDDPSRLQEVVSAALTVLARFGGALLQVETVDKGSTLKATFGAPLAHEDDERRATACARALLTRPELAGAAVGISTGTVFCGLIGSAARHEYSVLGDAVNVAARLMTVARPGQILADEATRSRAGDWGWRTVGPLAVRGRAGTVAAFEPTGELATAAAPRKRRPFVGRERELRSALELLERAAAGEGAVLTITGDAGIGKSRLLDELVAGAHERGMTVLRGEGQPFGRDVPYGAWRQAARGFIGDAADPIAAPLLGLPPRDTGLTPELLAEAVQDLVVEQVRRDQPALLAFDDAHWLDESSRALLRRLAREALRILLVVTVRGGEARTTGALPGGVTLALDALAPEAIARLVPNDLADAVVARAGGNPLFAEELASLLRESGSTALPDSLRSVVTARLDTLEERERAVLRIASVIGPRFAPEWLSGTDPRLGDRAEVQRTLAALTRLDIVHPDGSGHAFKHAVTREVAYDTLALAAREHLHDAVARHIERTHDLELPETLELLVHHYTQSADLGKRRLYLRRAGDTARAAFANDAATHHYRTLLPLLSGAEALDAVLDLGAVLQLRGEWAEAETLFRDAVANAGSEHGAARARAALGGLLAFTGAYPDAVGRLEEARASFAALGDEAALAGVLERLAHTYFQQGDDAAATARAREHAAIAHELGDRAGEGTAMNTLGLVRWHRGELEPARAQLEAALALALDAGNRVGAVHVLNDLAGLLAALGRPEEAIERLAEAYAEAREIGYRRFAGVIAGNAAELFQTAGDDEPALACAGRALEIAASLHDVIELLHSATVIAVVRRREGDPEGAELLLERVAAAARASDNRRYQAEARLHQARARRELGRHEAAANAAAEALRVARAVGQVDLAAQAEAILDGAADPAVTPSLHADATPFLDGAAPALDGAALFALALEHVK